MRTDPSGIIVSTKTLRIMSQTAFTIKNGVPRIGENGKSKKRSMNIYLCAGIGGKSVKSDENITIDIDPKTRPSIVADVRQLPLRHGLPIKNLLMTPPCTYLSRARNPWPREGIKWNLEIVGACLEAAAHLKPEAWFLENPNGNLKRIIGPAAGECVYSPRDIRKKQSQFWTNDRRALERAIIPEKITKALMEC